MTQSFVESTSQASLLSALSCCGMTFAILQLCERNHCQACEGIRPQLSPCTARRESRPCSTSDKDFILLRLQEGVQQDAGSPSRRAQRVAASALRIEPACIAVDLPGHGCRRQGWSDSPSHVGRESAGHHATASLADTSRPPPCRADEGTEAKDGCRSCDECVWRNDGCDGMTE